MLSITNIILIVFGCTVALILIGLFIASVVIVQEYERIVVFRLGKLRRRAKGPGLVFIIPCIDSYKRVDLRTVSFDIPEQETLTKDSVTVSIAAVVYYKVENPVFAIINVEDYSNTTQLNAMTTLRNVVGQQNLSEVLSGREQISTAIQECLESFIKPWGVKVEKVEIKDVRLPYQMQRAMAAEAEAKREAKAKIIAAEGELQASKSLKEAANIIAESPGAMQLRYLQTLNIISAEKTSTIIFPFPIDILDTFTRKK